MYINPADIRTCMHCIVATLSLSFSVRQNVVVVNQPAPTQHVVVYQVAQSDYLTATIVNMAICFICGGLLGVFLLIPALVCAIMVSCFILVLIQSLHVG